MTLSAAKQLWQSLGFPAVDDSTPYFTSDDGDALDTVQALFDEGVIDLDGAIRLGRLIGTASARIAEAGLAALHERGPESALEHMEIGEIVARMESILGYAWRRQLHAALMRLKLQEDVQQTGPLLRELGVGFADLVGFTSAAAHTSLASLASLTREFEEVSSLAISCAGGRVIKLIGDGVMFVADRPEELIACAEGVRTACSTHATLPQVRSGLAWGNLLLQNGDYFGPEVNLASRITSLVPGGAVALTDALHILSPAQEKRQHMVLRNIKGIGDAEVWIDLGGHNAAVRGAKDALAESHESPGK